MIRAACHCGAVRFEIAEPPSSVTDCNCTICRRHGALWAYYLGDDRAKLVARPAPGTTETYLWADRILAFHRCRTCGCVTHAEAVDPQAQALAVNARMMLGLNPAKVRIRQLDNGHNGFFWTRSDGPPIPSRHPPLPPAGPDDWR